MSLKGFLERPAAKQHKSYFRSKQQEKEMAGRIGGKRVSASGSGDTKGDVRLKNVARLELKTTSKSSFSITKAMLDVIEDAAIASNEVPVIVVEFNASSPRREVCVMPVWALQTLLANQKG